MGLMESLKSAVSFKRFAMPKEDPIRKHRRLFPDIFTSCSFAANDSEESNFPSGVKTQNQLPLGILVRIKSASFSSPADISAEDGLSGSLTSGNSKSLK